MNKIKYTLLVAFSIFVTSLSAQVVRKMDTPQTKKSSTELSIRARNFLEATQPKDEQAQWTRVVYREVDLTKSINASLYYPRDAYNGQLNLFRLLMREVIAGKLTPYEYLDGQEVFTPDFEVKAKDVLDRFHILYEEQRDPRGKISYQIDPSDIPAHEVLSYYIIEKWVFDKNGSMFFSTIDAICPILHRSTELDAQVGKYPMFWIDYEQAREVLTQHLVMSHGMNNTMRYSFDDFFAMRQYQGDIYKTRNLHNHSLMQQYVQADSLRQARQRIEDEIKDFEQALWVKQLEQKEPTEASEGKVTVGEPQPRFSRQAPAKSVRRQ